MFAFTETDDDFVVVHKVTLNDLINYKTYIDKAFFDNETYTNDPNYITHLIYDIQRSNYKINHLKISCLRQFKVLKNWKHMAKIINQGAFSLPCKILQSKLEHNQYLGELKIPSTMDINILSKNNTALLTKRLRIFELHNDVDYTINNVDISIIYDDHVTLKFCIW